MTLMIAEYTPDDYDDVWALHLYTITHNDGFVKNISFHTDLHDIPNVYEVFFIGREDGALAGMVGLKKIDNETLEVKRLQIGPDFQGKGCGRHLMIHAENYARTHGFKTFILDVSAPNAAARALYDKLGYAVTKVQKETYGPDEEEFLMTYMEKRL